MAKETIESLKWISSILNEHDIPYRVGGGMAMHLYGSKRPVNDIDISVSGKDFSSIIPLVSEYIVAGPKHYKNDKWDCNTLSLEHKGQEIDLTDADTLLMSNKDGTEWIENKKIYSKYPDVKIIVDGVLINIMNPQTLIEYKKELGGEHQTEDIEFLEQHIKDGKLSIG